MSFGFGIIIKEARAAKGLTQAAVAEQVDGITASDVGKIERGEKEPTQAVLKKMAKVLGVTQKSLLDAVTGTGKTTAAGKTSSTGKTTAKKTTAAKKTAAKAVNALTLTATEKKLVQLYRNADTKTKKAAINLLEGDSNAIELIGALLSANAKGSGSSGSSSGASGSSDLISALLSGKTGGSSGGAAGKDTMNALMDLLGKINK